MKICRVPADSRRNLEAEIAKNEEALAKATSIREKELAEFNAEEKDMLQSIGALKSAVVVLSKHHSSFAQVTGMDNAQRGVRLDNATQCYGSEAHSSCKSSTEYVKASKKCTRIDHIIHIYKSAGVLSRGDLSDPNLIAHGAEKM